MSDLLDFLSQVNAPLDAESRTFVDRVHHERPALVGTSFFAPTEPVDILANKTPYFEFQFQQGDNAETVLQNWSEKIEAELYGLGIKIQDKTQEALRGGTLLLSNLKWPDLKYGKDFTDDVLWTVVNERFGAIDLIGNILSQIPHNDPSRSREYHPCREFIRTSINGYGNSLVMQLHYDNSKEAFPILLGAVLYLLDRRHALTLRRAIFPR